MNAIDLYWDLILRTSTLHASNVPREYYTDFLEVVADESRHFNMLSNRLVEMGGHYGMIPAHKGLWQHGQNTRDSIIERLAIIPLVQEARGLDAGPRIVHKLISQDDKESARIVNMIVEEEVGHVKKGMKWFSYLCQAEGRGDPMALWQQIVREKIPNPLPAPFNEAQRALADLPSNWYLPVSDAALSTSKKMAAA